MLTPLLVETCPFLPRCSPGNAESDDGRDGGTTTAYGTDAARNRWSSPAVPIAAGGCSGCESGRFEFEYGGYAALGDARTLERRGQELAIRSAGVFDGWSSFYAQSSGASGEWWFERSSHLRQALFRRSQTQSTVVPCVGALGHWTCT